MKLLAAAVALVLLSGCATLTSQKMRDHADVFCGLALFLPPVAGVPTMLACPFVIDAIPDTDDEAVPNV